MLPSSFSHPIVPPSHLLVSHCLLGISLLPVFPCRIVVQLLFRIPTILLPSVKIPLALCQTRTILLYDASVFPVSVGSRSGNPYSRGRSSGPKCAVVQTGQFLGILKVKWQRKLMEVTKDKILKPWFQTEASRGNWRW